MKEWSNFKSIVVEKYIDWSSFFWTQINISDKKKRGWIPTDSPSMTRPDISNLMIFLQQFMQRISVRVGLHKLINYSVEVLKTRLALIAANNQDAVEPNHPCNRPAAVTVLAVRYSTNRCSICIPADWSKK